MEPLGRPPGRPRAQPQQGNYRGNAGPRPGGDNINEPRRIQNQPQGNERRWHGQAGRGQHGQGTERRPGGANARRGQHNPNGEHNRRPPPQRAYNDRPSEREQHVRRLGYKALEELQDKDPSEVVITLASHSGLRELLSATEMKSGLMELLCKVLSKACNSRIDRQSIHHILGLVKSSSFLRTCLPHYIVGMLTDPIPDRRHRYPMHISNILRILQEIASIFPASSVQETSLLITLLPGSINALRTSGVNIDEQIEQSLERVTGLVEHLQDKRREGTLRVDTHMTLEREEPMENYRNMSVYPTYDEIHQDVKPFLRPNTLSSKFESTALYLDTHFRLLREDFVRPMRDGIQEILQHHDDRGFRKRRFDDIRVYFDTRIVAPLCTQAGIVYKVHFDTSPLKMVRWQNSKRLLYGSLVCLSKDNFESFLFATVSNRDAEELKMGEVQLQFSEHSRGLLARTNPTDSFLMVETAAYFEAYRHVLEGLQEINEQDVPFQKYIVQCQNEVGSPRYLNMGTPYNLSCLVKQDVRLPSMKIKNVNILEPKEWPSRDDMGFDESQMEAVQLALTKELAIIQGPPGTGKTYVGLKIAQALLTNTNAWQFNEHSYPVLVVCYTNHALDQFLEGIHHFLEKGIVRVGGRSNSEVLKDFTLRQLRSKPDFRRNLPQHLRRAYADVTTNMKMAEQKLHEGGQLLQCSMTGIIHERFLEKHIDELHWASLHNALDDEGFCIQSGYGKTSMIVEWLGLGITPYTRTTAPTGPEEEVEEEEEEGEEDELIEVPEEADLIQAERVIEGDDESVRPKKRRNVVDTKELEQLLHAISIENKEPINPQGEEGQWEMTRDQKRKRKQKMKNELKKVEAMKEEELEMVDDLWSLDMSSRWRLYRLWLQLYQTEIRQKILTHEQQYQEASDRLMELRLQEDLQLLKQAKVIGMTTTGAAKFRKILQEVEPRIVIVEEAAEVLEAHTITTLSSACQHLILIGDHQQLRPSANVYDLAKNFNLEVSLFERLIRSDLPFIRLNYQHRMRPEIAQLLTPHIYQNLENHESVLNYENIKGVSTNVFFVEHDFPEQEISDGKSHQNTHEAEFIVEFCKYFLCQDYKPSQITILTTYTGQLFCLRKLMPAKTFSGVKVHVVDKYQGEENDIILLSLVRSNREGKVGFLQISNRICVALSRAKKGLYCIGNMNMLGKVPLWSKIILTLRQNGQIGKQLMLSCQNHPEVHTLVCKGSDFKKVPEGGCSQKCEFRLSCGHVCSRVCHPYDPEHKQYKCTKPCQKVLCEDGHRCTRSCYEPCGLCMVKVEKCMPLCSHMQMVPCSISVMTYCCQEPCNKFLGCGHKCEKLCGDKCEERCPQKISVTLKCGHTQLIKCWKKRDMEFGMPIKCTELCTSMLSCGHKCHGTCDTCFEGRFHGSCKKSCKRFLICSHECGEPCTNECPPCKKACENRCIHSQCKKECGHSCAPCIEPCGWSCQHYTCSKLCSEPCNRPPCNNPCPKQLKCGHPCIGLCGEPCPNKCRICHHEEVTELFFGSEDEVNAYFVQLEDCGHIFEVSGMDKYMKMSDNSNEETSIKLKVCPVCQTPIRRNLRYGTIVNRTLEEIERVKERIQGPADEIALTKSRLKDTLDQMVEFRRTFSMEYMELRDTLQSSNTSLRKLNTLENMMLFYKKLASLFRSIKNVDEKEKTGLKNRLLQIKGWVEKTRSFFTEQELSDLQNEVMRFSYLLELLVSCKAASSSTNSTIQNEIDLLREVLERSNRFTEKDEVFVKEKLKELKKSLQQSGLGISDSERVMIVKAMGLQTGHWFKCPNNHIYVITECGGAMETSKCPDCQETIGGTQHTLHSTNRLAREMDGAHHAAWSETANNLFNFENFL
ncbi:NFX1-type zinc finger-containing protein 1 [Bombina bombina]|uniref:NFX1-type zinc finger-containing protein 1 n=1 Tax=Bombina bombina TaxID=8345 RepID=UPI00235B11FE|nr:NFX1-type zinc finger-containing protein 1 [Bombina bombina]